MTIGFFGGFCYARIDSHRDPSCIKQNFRLQGVISRGYCRFRSILSDDDISYFLRSCRVTKNNHSCLVILCSEALKFFNFQSISVPLPSVATDSRAQFQGLNIVLNNRTGP